MPGIAPQCRAPSSGLAPPKKLHKLNVACTSQVSERMSSPQRADHHLLPNKVLQAQSRTSQIPKASQVSLISLSNCSVDACCFGPLFPNNAACYGVPIEDGRSYRALPRALLPEVQGDSHLGALMKSRLLTYLRGTSLECLTLSSCSDTLGTY